MDQDSEIILISLIVIALCFVLPAVRVVRYWRSDPARVGNLPHCRQCDYLAIGLTSDRCPECGSPLEIVYGERRRRLLLNSISTISVIFGAALLAAMIIVPKFTGRVTESPITFADTDLSNFRVALDVFQVDVGRYPTTAEGLRALVFQPPGVAAWQHAYLDKVPVDPWGTQYQYRSPGSNGAAFDLFSCGPDGVPNTADDIR